MRPHRDLTNMKFGKLTAISRIESEHGKSMWNCVCDCGKDVVCSANALLRGNTRSCGCLGTREDLVGRKFGELTVLAYDEEAKKEKKYDKWICECSCGKKVIAQGVALRKGRTRDCHGGAHSQFVGKRFGKLVVQPEFRKGKHHREYLCKCDCGNSVYVDVSGLTNNTAKSCGCLNFELRSARSKTHGMSKDRIYGIWAGMISRCECPGDKEHYMNYGGRGISVCKEWREDFMSFYSWSMEHGYSDNLSIDRIDVNGNYEPSNCRWATMKEQSNNKRNSILVSYNGKTQTLKQWAEEYNVYYKRLHCRYKYLGWDFEKALLSPIVYRGQDNKGRKKEG